MSEIATWGIVGPGNIGQELMRQLGQQHVADRLGLRPAPSFVIRQAGIMNPDGITPSGIKNIKDINEEHFPDVSFIALPSGNDGSDAKDHISEVLERGSVAVTAEKAALSNFYGELEDRSNNFSLLGINATVGGGTRVLDVAENYCKDVDNITQIHLALNGTLSAIMSMIAPPAGSGMSLGQAVHQAVELKYAEPGAQNTYDVIRGEAEGDIPKKTAILFNKLDLSPKTGHLDWNDLKFKLSDEEIDQAVDEAKVRRFIVSLYSRGYLEKKIKCPEDDIIGGFSFENEDWKIVGGFRNTDRNPLFDPLAKITGPGNGLVIGLGPDETDGVYSVTGPGAGVRPTVNTMIDDYVSMRSNTAALRNVNI